MTRNRWVLAALVALGAVGQPAAAQRPRVTLAEAIALAERVQPLVVQARGQTRTTGARLLSARGAYLPNLNLNANGSTFFSESQRIDQSTGELVTGGSRTKSVATSVSSSVELFDGFRRSNELGAANASDDAAAASLVDARAQQGLQTTNTFFDALAATRLLLVREASLRRAEQQLQTSVARLQAGAATRSDSLRSLVGVGNAQLQLITTQAQLASAEANLGRLTGQPGRVEAVDDSSLFRIVAAIDTAALRTEALARSPQVQAADADQRAAGASLKASRSTYWPSLVLSGSMTLDGNDRSNYTMLTSNRLSLGLSWPLFNRFTREQTVVNQSVALDNARASAEEARRSVVADLISGLANLDAARLRIEISQRSVQASQEDLRVQQERYRLGVSTILDVLTTQEQLTQAEVDAVTAWFDYLRAKATIEALIGRPL
ncbi:MAG TPA: TolC family protein [Gemmatimonadales bacterium]